ncbi:hypothetical protein SKAU_G00368330 [Synaphobranchus kaupii]|uniref:Uncharacterized protein n=1 Tax=Synaphobranchus kaupii TaxID=118154 RepID=A0A9Q1EFJ2_SYNKA|nr:hypothetical protein SKAU_G00368330 [Synaphobranchus kaupii]
MLASPTEQLLWSEEHSLVFKEQVEFDITSLAKSSPGFPACRMSESQLAIGFCPPRSALWGPPGAALEPQRRNTTRVRPCPQVTPEPGPCYIAVYTGGNSKVPRPTRRKYIAVFVRAEVIRRKSVSQSKLASGAPQMENRLSWQRFKDCTDSVANPLSW